LNATILHTSWCVILGLSRPHSLRSHRSDNGEGSRYCFPVVVKEFYSFYLQKSKFDFFRRIHFISLYFTLFHFISIVVVFAVYIVVFAVYIVSLYFTSFHFISLYFTLFHFIALYFTLFHLKGRSSSGVCGVY
jgi:hypothetical protein